MNKNEWKKWVGVVGRMLVAYAMVFAQGAWAAQNQATKDKAALPQKAAAQQPQEKQSSVATSAKAQTAQAQSEESESAVAEEKPSRDGSHEGIKVHGHWIIEVRDPDGSVVRHREFENSLSGVGPNFLAQCVASGCSITGWQIIIDGGGQAAPCSTSIGFGTGCIITANASVPTSGPNAGQQVILSGTVTANVTGVVQNVATFVLQQFGSTSTSSQFTSRTLTSTLSVAAQQIMAVTVVISFS